MFRFLGNTVAVAVGGVVIALGIKLLGFSVAPALQVGSNSPFLWLLPAIAISAWYGNFKTGLLSTGLATAIAYYCLVDPNFSLVGQGISSFDQAWMLDSPQEVDLGLFLLEGGLLSSLIGRVPFPRPQPSPESSFDLNRDAVAPQILQIVENTSDGFYLFDRQWCIHYVNPQGAEYLQSTPAALLGQQLWECYPEIDSVFYTSLHAAIETNQAMQFEGFCQGCNLWLEVQVYPTEQGSAVFARNITLRKQIEAERDQLLRREQAVRTTAEQAEQRAAFLAEVSKILNASIEEASLVQTAEAIVPFLGNGCLIFCLEAGRLQPVAIAAADAQQRPLLETFATHYQQHCLQFAQPPGLAQPASQLIEAAICETLFAANSEASAACEAILSQSCLLLPLVAHDRTVGIMQLVRDDSYTPAEVTLAEEIARRTAIAIDNAQLYRQAQMLNRLKDEFLSTLSHELRTPLNVISGWSQLLQMRQYDEMTNQAIDTIGRNVRLQAQIIDELLDGSRVITGRIQLQPAWTDLNAIVCDVINSLQVAADAKAIDLHYHSDPVLNQLWLDARYIRQVLWNLVGNAVKFTPSGGQVKVQLEQVTEVRDCSTPSPHRIPILPIAQLTVTDTGIGIHPDFLPYVFDRFRQEDGSTTRTHGGMGLGLAIVRHLVELHGGSIGATSDGVGQGATFILRLPLLKR